MKEINGFDFDGVIYHGKNLGIGIYPGPDDIIITGRSFEESVETTKYLREHGINNNKIYFNQVHFNQKTREKSGLHKANIINKLYKQGIKVVMFFEDDDIQINIIRENTDVVVIKVDSPIGKENSSHGDK